ncbi:hypothetical protein LCGC14_0231730 [marine sediment metagenome]|uniref:Uncharacterized protein n=1 Tax=marine sediment metagenome TaxID=412755 RepID=A0A0F9UA40_9ZZZZ
MSNITNWVTAIILIVICIPVAYLVARAVSTAYFKAKTEFLNQYRKGHENGEKTE